MFTREIMPVPAVFTIYLLTFYGCATFNPRPIDEVPFKERSQTQVENNIRVTAAGPTVGIPDIYRVENNIHAGVKYLAYLRNRYFNDPGIKPEDQLDFTFAAYNAGPARINGLRKKAEKIGLDPNRWFFNVEHVANGSLVKKRFSMRPTSACTISPLGPHRTS